MKILIVRTFPSYIYSNSYNVQEIGLAKALTRAGHTCGIVFYNGKNKDVLEKISVTVAHMDKEILIYRLHGYNILKNGIFPSLKKITQEYDVIQVHEYDQITSWFFYGFSKKPVVIYHGPYYHSFNKGYNMKCRIFDHTFLKVRHNRNVVCLTKSRDAREFLLNKGFEDVTEVGVGLDQDNFLNEKKVNNSIIPIPKDKFNLLYVGKIEERRNPYFLLDILNKMSDCYSQLNCIIIGDGETEYIDSFLKKASPFIQAGRLQYYSKASQQELANVYQNAQLMLFPTHYDIFGMVLLECLYFDLPVISAPNGGADMLIRDGENGWILPDGKVDVWCNMIKKISADKECYNKIKSYMKRDNHAGLCWDGLVKTFINAYDRAVIKGVANE